MHTARKVKDEKTGKKRNGGSAIHNGHLFIDEELTDDEVLELHGIKRSKIKDNVIKDGNGNTVEMEDKYTLKRLEDKQYKDLFGEYFEEQNERHRKKRNHKRVKTIEEYRDADKYTIAETVLQVGNVEDGDFKQLLMSKGVSENEAEKKYVELVDDFVNRFQEKYAGHLTIYSVSSHMDEASLHSHIRWNLYAVDENGVKSPNHSKALEQLGVELPEPNKKEGRKNTRLVTFTNEMRDMFEDVADEHLKVYGVEIDRERNENSKHVSIQEYKANKKEKNKLDKQAREIDEKRTNVNKRVKEVNEMIEKLNNRSKSLDKRANELDEREKGLIDREKALNEREGIINGKYEEMKNERKQLDKYKADTDKLKEMQDVRIKKIGERNKQFREDKEEFKQKKEKLEKYADAVKKLDISKRNYQDRLETGYASSDVFQFLREARRVEQFEKWKELKDEQNRRELERIAEYEELERQLEEDLSDLDFTNIDMRGGQDNGRTL